MRTARLLHGLVILFLAGAVGACVAPTQNLKERGNCDQALSSGNKSIVFGRVQWLEHGEEKKIGKGLFDFSISPNLLRMEDKSKTYGEVDENGTFVWSLEPGIYVINRINYRDPWSGNYFMVPKVAFRVPDKGKIYYIGTLRADFAYKRDLIGGLSGQVKVTIEDQGQRDNAAIAETLGIMPKDVEKSLMVHDERLPRTIDTTEEFNMAVQTLNAILFGLSH
jgi:hypothetical protein